MKQHTINPFIISGYISPEYFCDRESETAVLKRHLDNGNNVTLTSPRRMGKTGLILHTFNQIQQDNPDAVTVYVDLMPTESLADFARVFSVALMEKLDSTPLKILKKAASFLSWIRPTVYMDPISGEPKFTVSIERGDEQKTVEQLLDYIGKQDKKFFVAFDEFQQISTYPEKNVEALLRSKIQFLSNARFIFSGSKLHLLSEMFSSAKRPFYSSTALQNIGPIAVEPYYSFASKFFTESGRTLPDDAFTALYGRFEGHTWYIQKVLNKLYTKAEGDISSADVQMAIDEILQEEEFFYQAILKAYPKGQGNLLKAIAKERRIKEIYSGAFIAKYGLNATSSVKGALKRLLEDEQIYQDENGYIVYNRFMAEWLRKTV